MEHLATSDLSEYQMLIIEERLEKKTYEEICESFFVKYQIKIYDNKISKAIKKAVIGYKLDPGMSGGVDPYLCTDNLNDLKEEVKNAQEFRYPFDCSKNQNG